MKMNVTESLFERSDFFSEMIKIPVNGYEDLGSPLHEIVTQYLELSKKTVFEKIEG